MKQNKNQLTDSNEILIDLLETVLVPAPMPSDLYKKSFIGTVVGFLESYVTVEDQDGNCFDIEPDRLTIQ